MKVVLSSDMPQVAELCEETTGLAHEAANDCMARELHLVSSQGWLHEFARRQADTDRALAALLALRMPL